MQSFANELRLPTISITEALPNACSDILYTVMFHEAVNLIHERAFCTYLPEECFTRFL